MSFNRRGGGQSAGKRRRDDDDDPDVPASSGTDVDADALFKLELSAKKRLKVYKFKDMLLCDIREMWQNAEGRTLPGKKGADRTFMEHG